MTETSDGDGWAPCPVCGGKYPVLYGRLIWDGLDCDCEWLAIPLWHRAVKVVGFRVYTARVWCSWHLCRRWLPGAKTREQAKIALAYAEVEAMNAARAGGQAGEAT